ncbi:MAG: hypothetical protein AABW46_04210 [Nanoarchaeota archaeon]
MVLKKKMTQSNGDPIHKSGYTLTIFCKESNGKWRLAHDANLLTVNK